MKTALPEAPATHFRLSEESKAKAIAEYRSGRTAKQVGRKWKVSGKTIYNWAAQAGVTKRECGDAVARENAAADEAEARRIQAIALAEPPPLIASAPSSAEPGALAEAALRGVAEALRQERLDEAAQLTRIADGLGRMAERGSTGSLETIFRAITDGAFRTELFSMIGDENNELKKAYWEWAEAVSKAPAWHEESFMRVLKQRDHLVDRIEALAGAEEARRARAAAIAATG